MSGLFAIVVCVVLFVISGLAVGGAIYYSFHSREIDSDDDDIHICRRGK